MDNNGSDLWSYLTKDEHEEFVSIHVGEDPAGEDRLDELLEIAQQRANIAQQEN